MTTLIQKVYIPENLSFACQVFTTPNFETKWHIHEEIEIIVIVKASGTAMIGDYIGEYRVGDLYFIGSNVPHCFRKYHDLEIGSALVLQFKKDVLGVEFLNNPELEKIASLVKSANGLLLKEPLRHVIEIQLVSLQIATGYERIKLLLDILHQISIFKHNELLTRNTEFNHKNTNPIIEYILDYTFKNYLEVITLQEIAKVAKMSIPTFCRFFKKNIKKTYFDFLQDLRITQASKLLRTTDKSIQEICFKSGYNSWAHFSKQFKEVQKMTPNKYRKAFVEN